jgi:hypothetical protein
MHLGKSEWGQAHSPWHQRPSYWKQLPETQWDYLSLCTWFQGLASRLDINTISECTKIGGFNAPGEKCMGAGPQPMVPAPKLLETTPSNTLGFFQPVNMLSGPGIKVRHVPHIKMHQYGGFDAPWETCMGAVQQPMAPAPKML